MHLVQSVYQNVYKGQRGRSKILTLTVDGDVLLLDVYSVLVILVGVAGVGHETAQCRAVVTGL